MRPICSGASAGLFASDNLMFVSFFDAWLQISLIVWKLSALRAAEYAHHLKVEGSA